MIAISKNYPDAYLGALFKNAKKCQLLKLALMKEQPLKLTKKKSTNN
jgi:hypothetical protein